jgi:hypothetical protein
MGCFTTTGYSLVLIYCSESWFLRLNGACSRMRGNVLATNRVEGTYVRVEGASRGQGEGEQGRRTFVSADLPRLRGTCGKILVAQGRRERMRNQTGDSTSSVGFEKAQSR